MIILDKNNQNQAPIFAALQKYIDNKVVPFHVPGHKQGRGLMELRDYVGERILQMDVNGMADLDYFNNPTGVIHEAEKLFAEAFGANEAFFLVNGTTSGIQAMIMSLCSPGHKIILPRNAHRSAISGIILSGALPIYIEPEIDENLGIAHGVNPAKVEEELKLNPDTKAIFLVSPTYYGYTTNVEKVVEIANKYKVEVIVDEAHGSHMYFHDNLPKTAIDMGAHMSALSMHKTGGSLTQSSALLMGDSKVSPREIQEILNLLFTSSASYLLLASLDLARKQMALHGRDMLENVLKLSQWARNELNKIQGVYAFGKELVGNPGCEDFDQSKLGLNIRGLGYTGYEMEMKLRREYNIQIEFADLNNILLIISLGDRKEDLQSIIDALGDISKKSKIRDYTKVNPMPKFSKTLILPREAYYKNKIKMKLDKSIGKISGEIIMAYPPGIPIITMGELITKEIIDYINILKKENCQLQGAKDRSLETIMVVE